MDSVIQKREWVILNGEWVIRVMVGEKYVIVNG
jgi:hypothetical protein